MNELQGDRMVSVFITVLQTTLKFTGIIFTLQIFVFWITFLMIPVQDFFSLFEQGGRIIIHDVSQPFTSLSFSFLQSFGLLEFFTVAFLAKYSK